jgi:hypothetical protein
VPHRSIRVEVAATPGIRVNAKSNRDAGAKQPFFKMPDGDMLQKIVSNGLNATARAALDAALHLDIAYAGWIAKGEATARNRAASPHDLQELPSGLDCIEKSVMSADGTLLLTRGEIDGELKAGRDFAHKNGRLFLHIDLAMVPAFKASTVIAEWLMQKQIAVLNVAGPEADEAPDTYERTFRLITSAFWLCQDKLDTASRREPGRPRPGLPQSIAEAVSRLMSEMSLKDRTTMANMTSGELAKLNFSLGAYIRNEFGIWSGNEDLLAACRAASGNPTLPRKEAATVIIRKLWEELRRTHKLRIVK